MFQYIIKRLLQSILTLLLLSFVCYFVLTLMPGDPVDMMAAGNPNITSEDMQRLKALYGLDQPAYKRYMNWMGTLLSGDYSIKLLMGRFHDLIRIMSLDWVHHMISTA